MSSHPAVEGSTIPNYQHLTYDTIPLNDLLAQSHHEMAGAVVLFSGEVRRQHLGKEVNMLKYEAFEAMAEQMIASILNEAKQKWDLNGVFAIHRLGEVGIKECAVCVITTSAHRKEAYESNQYIIHRIKHEVPIWKKEIFADGTSLWGNNCNCADPDNHEPFI